MRTSSALVGAGTGLAVTSLGLTLDNLRHLRVPDPDAPSPREHLCVLLPVRDEARVVERCLRALLAAAEEYDGRVDVLVLDDRSDDGTADLVNALAADDSRVRLLRGTPTPQGWQGKCWACHQLCEAADPDATVLLFVDADVTVRPSCLRATVGLLRSSGLDLVCPYPRQLTGTAVEHLVQPLLQWSWMSTLPLGLAERSPRPTLGAANGQLLCVDAAAYHRAGGHRAVRSQVLEDLALLRAVKASGGRGGVTEGSTVADCRMYDGWHQLRDGYAKSLWAAFGSPAGGLVAVGLLSWAYLVPPLAALRGSRIGLLGYAAAVASRVVVAHRTGGRAAPDALLHPASILLLDHLVLRSLRGRRAGTLRWKGRPVVVGVADA